MNIPALLKFRLLQAERMAREIGWLLGLLLVFVSIAFIFQIIKQLWALSFTEGLLAGAVFLLIIHFTRKDLLFLHHQVDSTWQLRQLILAEYALALSPFLLLTMAGGNFMGGSGLLLSLVLSLFIPLKHDLKLRRKWNPPLSWTPPSLFEMKAMLRKSLPFFYLLYFFALMSVLNIAFFVLSIVIMGLILSAAFEPMEPKELISWNKSFFKQKIIAHSLFVQGMLLPVYLLCLFFHLTAYWMVLAGVIFLQMMLVFSIFYKYAHYRPTIVRVPQNIVHALFFIFLLIPGLQLVSLLFIIWYGRKAKRTMEHFFGEKTPLHA